MLSIKAAEVSVLLVDEAERSKMLLSKIYLYIKSRLIMGNIEKVKVEITHQYGIYSFIMEFSKALIKVIQKHYNKSGIVVRTMCIYNSTNNILVLLLSISTHRDSKPSSIAPRLISLMIG